MEPLSLEKSLFSKLIGKSNSQFYNILYLILERIDLARLTLALVGNNLMENIIHSKNQMFKLLFKVLMISLQLKTLALQ